MEKIHMLKAVSYMVPVAAALCMLAGCGGSPKITVESNDGYTEETETAIREAVTPSSELYVYVAGRVKKPDVYKVPEGSRVYQLIELAGGFEEDADTVSINLADRVHDGMKIIVYAVGEEPAGDADTPSQSRFVNINTASKKQLMTLPGIGAAKADSIVRYREENGYFHSIEDIMNISGIKEGAFDKIKDFITV